MTTQEAQALVQNWKGSKDDPKYLEAKAFLEGQDTRPWYEKDSHVAEDTIAKYDGQTSEDIAQQRLTKEQQGIQAKGNQGDNALANPNALDSAEVDKVHKIEKAAAQTPENMEPGTFTSDRDAALEAAGITKPGETAEIKESDSKGTKNAKGRYNKSMMSIWDAYHNGLIDKETAGYFTVDALATLAKNLGRGIGNVGAQFTGGSIDQGHDESMWDQRKNEIFNQELQGEAESIDNYTNTMKKYNLTKASTVNDLLKAVKADIDKLDDKNPLKIAYMSIAAQMANGQIDGTSTIAATAGKGITSLLDLLKGKE